jgi:hypothetical protein
MGGSPPSLTAITRQTSFVPLPVIGSVLLDSEQALPACRGSEGERCNRRHEKNFE